METRVAFVTGASRGIGRMTALTLAQKGFDVVLAARTLEDGERHERGPRDSDDSPMPGSLRATAAEIAAMGRRALPLRMDLMDTGSMDTAVADALAAWGRIDLLVNNAIYQGPGTMNPVMELTQQQLANLFQGNVSSQLHLIQRVLPHMLERGSGTIVNVVSESGMRDPPGPIGKGGWGFAYSASKAAFIRLAGVLKAEYGDTALRFYNMEPGFVLTENVVQRIGAEAFAGHFGGAPMEVPAAIVAWLATDPAAEEFHGTTCFAQRQCLKLGLVPEWQPKRRAQPEA